MSAREYQCPDSGAWLEAGHRCDLHHVAVEAGEPCPECEEEQAHRWAMEAADPGPAIDLAECDYCSTWCAPYEVTDRLVCRDCVARAERDCLPPVQRPRGCWS